MAFIRWRGRCAQLLATMYVDGHSKQITLTNLPGFYITEATKHYVAEKFPNISVDWVNVIRSLAEGPPNSLKEKTPTEHLDMAVVEQSLRKWAAEAKVAKHANHLYDAAGVLTEWRANFYRENELIGKSKSTCYNAP
ncbi:hypothetical protein [Dehalobacter restrictus]|uniref:hypothetical protein n=1 Tax=Dehalobacter restrictus TaxID=55583 RepID=UPI00338FF613